MAEYILVVDDHIEMADMLAEALNEAGWRAEALDWGLAPWNAWRRVVWMRWSRTSAWMAWGAWSCWPPAGGSIPGGR